MRNFVIWVISISVILLPFNAYAGGIGNAEGSITVQEINNGEHFRWFTKTEAADILGKLEERKLVLQELDLYKKKYEILEEDNNRLKVLIKYDDDIITKMREANKELHEGCIEKDNNSNTNKWVFVGVFVVSFALGALITKSIGKF